jgi:hypothetical protein
VKVKDSSVRDVMSMSMSSLCLCISFNDDAWIDGIDVHTKARSSPGNVAEKWHRKKGA